MGWRGALRSLNAASNRQQRERERAVRRVNRTASQFLSKVDREAAAALARTEKLEEALKRDPAKVLEIEYALGVGFEAKPVEFGGEIIKGAMQLVQRASETELGSVRFSPRGQCGPGFQIEPLDIMFFPYGVLVAVRVTNDEPTYRIRLNWVKRDDPSSSPVYLTDPRSHDYYYPTGSTLSGEVVPGSPRIGVLAFEPVRRPVRELKLHMSGLKLSSAKGKEPPFEFLITSVGMLEHTAQVLSHRSLSEQAREQIERVKAQVLAEIQQAMKRPSGCALIFILAIVLGWRVLA